MSCLIDGCILIEIDRSAALRPDRFQGRIVSVVPDGYQAPCALGQFVFPNGAPVASDRKPSPSRTFHEFALTSANGTRSFGFVAIAWCENRTENRFVPRAVCILSQYPFFQTMRQFLEAFTMAHCASDVTGEHLERIWRLLGNQTFSADSPVYARLNSNTEFRFALPEHRQGLPLSDVNYPFLFRKLDPTNIIHVFNALLNETPVAFVSHFAEALAPCQEAFLSLLYPMQWPFLYIPILPSNLVDFLHVPQPYVVGIVSHTPISAPEHALVVDLDRNRLSGYLDLKPLLPSRLRWRLRDFITRYWSQYHVRHPDACQARLPGIPDNAVVYPEAIPPPRPNVSRYRCLLDIDVVNELYSGAEEQEWTREGGSCPLTHPVLDRGSVTSLRSQFASVFVSLLAGYSDCVHNGVFNEDEFLVNADESKREFLSSFVASQMFSFFIQHRDETIWFHRRLDSLSNRIRSRIDASTQRAFWGIVFRRSMSRRWITRCIHVDRRNNVNLYRGTAPMVELVNELHRLAVTPTSVGIDPRRLSSHQMKAVKRVEDELDRIKPSAFKSVMFSIDDPAGRTKVRCLFPSTVTNDSQRLTRLVSDTLMDQ
ncbi:UDENN domain-containing protein [Plasmodiophora brassicae]|uniref:UDENN domain-containing protein n=1 Tax=Plasmodiophora brassicae TaxID=37360 RepID=A0A0G4ILG8_PLABS|nr:hypothetical protein PBRA_004650 [Plasmodiophora brassicae]